MNYAAPKDTEAAVLCRKILDMPLKYTRFNMAKEIQL